ANTPRALSNRFFVMTTRVTYSAANLFVSIVKDMDLAIVVGRTTMGGAAAVTYGVLPNNLIMTYSSSMVFIDKNDQIIETRIQPHYLLDSFFNTSQYIDKMKTIFSSRVSYTVE